MVYFIKDKIKEISIGDIIENWSVNGEAPRKNRKKMWTCECQYEDKTIRDLGDYELRIGKTTSCGCSQSLNIKINTEYNCTLKPINPDTGYILPYDVEIIDYKIICEIHGDQHYHSLRENHPWLDGLSPQEYLEKRKKYDSIKKEYAIKNGYKFLELSTTLLKDSKYKEIINNILG